MTWPRRLERTRLDGCIFDRESDDFVIDDFNMSERCMFDRCRLDFDTLA